jgi:hypothetical protein
LRKKVILVGLVVAILIVGILGAIIYASQEAEEEDKIPSEVITEEPKDEEVPTEESGAEENQTVPETVTEEPKDEEVPTEESQADKDQTIPEVVTEEAIDEGVIAAKELLNLAREAYDSNKYWTFGEERYELPGISYSQVIKVKGEIDWIEYNEKPDGPHFSITLLKWWEGRGHVVCRFDNATSMRAEELIKKGFINIGDEVIIQGKYSGYKIDITIGSTKVDLIVHLEECCFIEK